MRERAVAVAVSYVTTTTTTKTLRSSSALAPGNGRRDAQCRLSKNKPDLSTRREYVAHEHGLSRRRRLWGQGTAAEEQGDREAAGQGTPEVQGDPSPSAPR